MRLAPTFINRVWEGNSIIHGDERGIFFEWYKSSALVNEVNLNSTFVQGNTSISKKGVIRGLHLSQKPKAQTKLIVCGQGSMLDIAVDVRVDSNTFGEYYSRILSANSGEFLLLESGIAHGFQALEDNTSVTYLVTQEYDPKMEVGINPLDPALKLPWIGEDFLLSDKDRNAPSLKEVVEMGLAFDA